ncbi:hypothetical protein CLAFUW4_11182 [Fulvia fulva]|nr:hypothetical protein CLAFUR4_11187 [Fulvia fulva]KAK4620764.1 hypothetical protein CLAFUR0_11192 [Fulvia fulva]WPV17456.1 hypothetical protein CLAFUW4_11182 [Fulvia fulva]WPV32292.1 hypothetical protein CLAFUW7_11178 [Fulvia fulva]
MAPKNIKEIIEMDDEPSPSSSGASSPVVVGSTTVIENLVERLQKLERKSARQKSCSDVDSDSESEAEDESSKKKHHHSDKPEHDTLEKDQDDDEEETPIETDHQALIKKLYEGKFKCKCCTNWVSKYPQGIEKPTEQTKESWRSAALLLRYKKSHSDLGEDPFQLHSVTIQSPHLRKLAQEVLHDYPAIDTSLQKLVFKAPFWPFYHRWNLLEGYRASVLQSSTDGEEVGHVNTLYDVLHEELRDALATSKELAANGNIDFDLLWTIFPPGCVAFERIGTVDRCYLVTDCEYGSSKRTEASYFLVHLAYLDYDGDMYGWTKTKTYMFGFKDVRRISELKLVPKEYRQGADEVISRLVERGNKAKSLVTGAYKAYRGFIDNHKSEPWVDGRIMVDTTEYYKNMSCRHFVANFYPIGLQSIVPEGEVCLAGTDGDDVAKNTVIEDVHIQQQPPSKPHPDDLMDPFANLSFPPMPPMPYCPPDQPRLKKKGKRFGKSPKAADFSWAYPSEDEPTPEDDGLGTDSTVATSMETMHGWTHCVFGIEPEAFCPPTVAGYCLTTKIWTSFAVDNIFDIEWNDVAFEKLVMPSPRKRLLKALVQEHKKHKDHSDDVIRGKGQGLVLLLAGPPGTGKTLTAESVADKLRLPLYALDANQLGERENNDFDPENIEDELNKVFKLAAAWDAVLLLEEADAFLEPRVDDDDARERNKRIAAFLRVLEYYKGILILTTNRSTHFDDALYSRIHLTLRFPSLDEDAKKAVWRNFLDPVTVDITDQDFDELAQEDMNGRQIKNVVKMARLLAEAEEEELGVGHLMDVISVIKDSNADAEDDDDESHNDSDSDAGTERDSVTGEKKSETPTHPIHPVDPFANMGMKAPPPPAPAYPYTNPAPNPFATPNLDRLPPPPFEQGAEMVPHDRHTIKLPAGPGSKWCYSVSVG